MARIAVVIPIGPEAHHARYLREAWDSVLAQTRKPDAIYLIDDMHARDLDQTVEGWQRESPPEEQIPVCWFEAEWRLGVGAAFNWGAATALRGHSGIPACDLAYMMGSDDRLGINVLSTLELRYEVNGRRDGYYWADVQYSTGESQSLPCGNAAMTAGFMNLTGGFPVEAACGMMDSTLISALLVHHPDLLVKIGGGEDARVWARIHAEQETAALGPYTAAAGIVRSVFTERFKRPTWGRTI